MPVCVCVSVLCGGGVYVCGMFVNACMCNVYTCVYVVNMCSVDGVHT